ncbi:hypothetical protein [Micromonospora sp. NPDC049891]|uniref:hypothetical protein n=1 Tax=Micromonospora sp. NPDC049891 TaxID=3155655 RepID=UPI0033DAF27F
MADRPDWSEDEYVQCLQDERRRFAWVMQRYGGLSATQARVAATQRYPFEADDAPYRGLVFHDEAWRWAMLKIYGEGYWIQHPELVEPSAEYRALD